MSEIKNRIMKILKESKVSFMEDDDGFDYKNSKQAVAFDDVYEFMKTIAPDLDYVDNRPTKDLYWMIYEPATPGLSKLDSKRVVDLESKLAEKFGEGVVKVKLANTQYAPEIEKIYIGFIDKADVEDNEDLEEGWKDNLKKGVATLGVAGALAGNAMAHDPMYDGAQRPFDNPNMTVELAQRLADEDEKATHLSDGTVIDQYGNKWTKEDWEMFMNGIDPNEDNDYPPEKMNEKPEE